MPSPPSLLEALLPLRPVLDEAWATLDDPDYGGGRWLELYRGNPMEERFTVVDAVGNILHVQRRGREALTVTYIPGWLLEVATLAFTMGPSLNVPAAQVDDLPAALPHRFDLWLETETAQAAQEVDGIPFTRPAMGYEFQPAHAVAVETVAAVEPGSEAVQPEDEPPAFDAVHWGPMRLRLVAAPGVRFSRGAVLSASALDAARAAWQPHIGAPTASQALAMELHRRQDPAAVPGLGAPWRDSPLAEADLVAGTAIPPEDRLGRALAMEVTRPNGVDILVARPAEATAPASWLGGLMAGAINAVVESAITAQGGIPRDAPILVRIRVDPASAEDRFAYRLTYLDRWGQPWTEPTDDLDGEHPVVRLAVIRTAGVQVSADLKLSSWGEAALEDIVEYTERVVHFDDVPAVLTEDDEPTRTAVLPDQPATLEDILTVLYYVGSVVPYPAVQALYDLEDAASLMTWLVQGTDVWGEEMTAVDAALTVGGFVMPEVAERVAKRLVASVRRLRTVGDDPFSRLIRAVQEVTAADAELAASLAVRVEATR